MRRALLTAAILALARPAAATDCIFYLKRSSAGLFTGRYYSPGLQKDRPAGPSGMLDPEVAWDGRFHRIYWLAGGKIHRKGWLEEAKSRRPIELPEEFLSRAGWWIQDGNLQVAIFAQAGKALERWEYRAPERTWKMIERERLLKEDEPLSRQGARAWFAWSSRRRDWPLEARLARMRGNALMGPHIRWEGTRESGQGFWPFFDQDGCGLKLQVQRDDAGAHVVAPLVHYCEKPRKKRKRQEPEPEEEPLKGRVLYDSPEGTEFAPLAFHESGPYLLVGRESVVSGAVLFRQKDGSVAKRFPPDVSHAAWVPCPAR